MKVNLTVDSLDFMKVFEYDTRFLVSLLVHVMELQKSLKRWLFIISIVQIVKVDYGNKIIIWNHVGFQFCLNQKCKIFAVYMELGHI